MHKQVEQQSDVSLCRPSSLSLKSIVKKKDSVNSVALVTCKCRWNTPALTEVLWLPLFQVLYSTAFLLFLLIVPTEDCAQGGGGDCGFCGLPQTAARRVSEQRLSNVQKVGLEGPQTPVVTESFPPSDAQTFIQHCLRWSPGLWLNTSVVGMEGQVKQPCPLPHN